MGILLRDDKGFTPETIRTCEEPGVKEFGKDEGKKRPPVVTQRSCANVRLWMV